MKANNYYRRIAVCAGILLAVGLLSGWFHHHDDQTLHSDCPLCISARQVATVSGQTEPVPFTEEAANFVASPRLHQPSSCDRKAPFVRGPPA